MISAMRRADREAQGLRMADIVEEVGRHEERDVASGPRLEAPAPRTKPDLVEADMPTPLLPPGVGRPVPVRDMPDLRAHDRRVVEREVQGGAREREAGRRQEDVVEGRTHHIDVQRGNRIRVVVGISRRREDDHLAVNDRMELALKLLDARPTEGEPELVSGLVTRLAVVGI
jgi:hypothetical protein